MRQSTLAAILAATLAAGFSAPAGLTAGGQAVPAVPAPAPLPFQGPGGQPPAKGTALIVGQVVDGTTGKPVGGALVTLSMTVTTSRGQGQGAGPLSTTTTTTTTSDGRGVSSSTQTVVTGSTTGRVLADGEGHFMFHDLPAGNANLAATAPGYNSGSFGMTRPNDPPRPIRLAEGERMSTATVRLWKLCTIAGTVSDEAGEPLVNVQVNVLRFSTSNGTRRTEGGPTTTTDDRGAYHFLLSSGDYLLVVPATSTSIPMSSIDMFQQAINTPGQITDLMRGLSESGAPGIGNAGYRLGNMQFSTSGSMARNSPPPKPDGPLLAYQTTYFPTATTPAQAETLSLAPGEDRTNVDLSMRLATTVRVVGTLVGPDGAGGNLGVRLVAADSKDAQFNNSYPTATTLSDATGAFTFLGVPSGQYELQVTRMSRPQVMAGPNGTTTTVVPNTPTLWARVPVSVGATDLGGLLVSLRTGLKISGRIEFDGASPKPASDRLVSMSIQINDVDGGGQTFPARLNADGTFSTQGLVPGRFLAFFQGSPGPKWVLKSVIANEHDISAGPQAIDGDVANAIVTFTDHPNELSGTVQGLTSLTPAPVTGPNLQPVIVVFPANYQAWLAGGTNGRQSRTMRIGQTAQFSTTALPAGDYDVAAIPAEFANTWQDPKTLEIIARGASHVTMGDDDHRTVDLRPLTIR